MEKWHVVTSFYDNGKVKAVILDGREVSDEQVPKPGEYSNYDLYVDTFDNLPEAEQWRKDALNA
ncbi:hypothetical protein [Paenibacillus senegalensis]|uniref:hypothetical protein n=1 Tax=Paenibacillus senegalensis TaxID=1465766 RepID=UPI000288D638|nr:hypothetical protein [Paenibacillus senegalensis]